MKSVRFAILHHGYIEGDQAWSLALPVTGDINEKHPTTKWVRNPSFSVLIDHPDVGYILYDTGSTPGDEKERRPADARRLLPIFAQRDEFLDAQLSKIGITPSDISLVIVSHMHSDHCGGLLFFSNTKAGRKIYVGKKEFEFGLVETHRSCTESNLAYIKEDFEFPGLSFNLVEEDETITSGVDIIQLEGHTPCILGLVLKLNSGCYIFPSDAVYSAANYGPPMRFPGYIYDTLGYVRSVKRLHSLQESLHAKIIFPHDPIQYEDLKRAPFFYD